MLLPPREGFLPPPRSCSTQILNIHIRNIQFRSTVSRHQAAVGSNNGIKFLDIHLRSDSAQFYWISIVHIEFLYLHKSLYFFIFSILWTHQIAINQFINLKYNLIKQIIVYMNQINSQLVFPNCKRRYLANLLLWTPLTPRLTS